mgnify:CR=1 FL=1
MSVLPVGFASASGVDVGDIGHSLRLRSAASASWSRTPANNNSRTVWTYSEWIKRGELGTDQLLLDAGTDGNNESAIRLTTANKLDIYNYVAASYGCRRVTTAVLRDPTAFFNLVVASNGTTSFKIWINGVEITAFDTNSGTNGTNWFFNHSSYAMYMGKRFNNTNYFDGERARGCFIGGSALTAADFGYFNTEINEWVSKSQSAIKALVDAGDSNSSMLEFDDATSLTTLGYDKSSKGNNWTLNNVSLTAGTTYDYMLDVPGNSYCTINPLMYRASTGQAIYSYANLRATNDSGVAGKYIWGTQYVSSGKYYWETLVEVVGSSINGIGVDSGLAQNTVFNDSVIYFSNGHKYVNNVDTAYGATYTTGDVIGTLLDKTANTVEFFKNGTSQGVINLVSTSVALGMHSEMGGSNGIHVLNFGQRTFSYPSNQGTAKALCQENLPDPAILNPELHFDVRTRTGTAATYSVTDLLFQPDLAWIKSRGRAVDHALYDSVRGVQKQLESNQTGAETTETTGITAFNSNGYTGGALDQINGTTATNSFVDWLWKAGGAPVTNNSGSISSQVSANVLAGQSVVTYIGTGVNATVGHGLSSAPELVIVKNRNSGSATDWDIYHTAIGNTYSVQFNTSAKIGPSAVPWNNTSPTVSVFSVGTGQNVNESGKNLVALCFHSVPGYSKVFSYTGNGSADGPFVHLGFKPKFVMIKRTDSTGSWQVFDSIRAGYNVDNDQLVANTSAAEVTTDLLDLTANGFKLRSTSTEVNASSGTYIFLAVADVPAKYSLAR